MRINLLFLVVLMLFSCEEEKKEHFDLVIKNGHCIDIVTGEITVKTIFISEGRIVKFSTANSNLNYNTENLIDAKGKYILPGFWDNHVHFRGGKDLIEANKAFLKLYIANGITTVRDAGGDLTPSIMEWKKQIAKGNLIGPTIYTSGPKIDGPNARWAGSLVVENEEQVNKALDSLQQIKTDFVKIYESTISGTAYLSTVREARKRDLITSGHMPFSVTLEETVNAGLGAVEHLYYVLKGCSRNEKEITEAILNKELSFWQSMAQLIASYDDETAQKTFQLLKNNNTYVVPTLHIGNTLSYLDEENHENDQYLKFMAPEIVETYKGRINSALSASPKAIKNRKALNTLFKRLTKSLSDSAVKLLAGSDSGAYNSYTYPGISLHNELEAMVATGMSPLKALQTSAYNGAHFLKKETHYGTLEVGKVSDMVLLNKNPLNEISNTKTVFRVVKGNTVFDPKEILSK